MIVEASNVVTAVTHSWHGHMSEGQPGGQVPLCLPSGLFMNGKNSLTTVANPTQMLSLGGPARYLYVAVQVSSARNQNFNRSREITMYVKHIHHKGLQLFLL